jgi:hypothetical protein
MSLINDALKRASESDRNRPAQAALPALMQPVAKRPHTRVSMLLAAIAVAAVGLALAGWCMWKWWGATHTIVAAAPVLPGRSTVASPPPPAATPSPAVVTAPASVLAPTVSISDGWPTNLTVKAIIYSKTSPRALVNGKMVGTGDTIEGVLVTGILSDRIFVDFNGQSREIKIGGQ